jgi:hypothetical protein
MTETKETRIEISTQTMSPQLHAAEKTKIASMIGGEED